MRWPERCPVCETLKPRSFSALMELYEQNYLRVRCLVPELKSLEGEWISHASGCLRLRLRIIEQARHTTTFQLSYLMSGNESRPDVVIRVYHDALQAEILDSKCNVVRKYLSPQPRRGEEDSALLCRWKTNRFLYKWLNYLKRQGHGFQSVTGVFEPTG